MYANTYRLEPTSQVLLGLFGFIIYVYACMERYPPRIDSVSGYGSYTTSYAVMCNALTRGVIYTCFSYTICVYVSRGCTTRVYHTYFNVFTCGVPTNSSRIHVPQQKVKTCRYNADAYRVGCISVSAERFTIRKVTIRYVLYVYGSSCFVVC